MKTEEIKNVKEVLNYMKQYVENKYEHDSEPMLNYKDLQLVLDYIKYLEKKREELEHESVEANAGWCEAEEKMYHAREYILKELNKCPTDVLLEVFQMVGGEVVNGQ